MACRRRQGEKVEKVDKVDKVDRVDKGSLRHCEEVRRSNLPDSFRLITHSDANNLPMFPQ